MEENNIFEAETSVEESNVTEDLSAKLEEAGTLSEKACIAIGALALAGTVALGNCAWKGGKKVVNWAKDKIDAHKEKKESKKAEEEKASETEEKAEESKNDSGK